MYNKLFIDFEIYYRMASLRKLYFLTLTYFLKVKDSNRDLPTVANVNSSVTCAVRVLQYSLVKDVKLAPNC